MKRKKNDYAARALVAHKKLRGKIEVRCKAKVASKDDLSIYYTPGVAAVSSYVAKHKKQMKEYTMKGNTVAIVSDGSAVLGLGNIGPEGALPVMEGKAMLFKTFADIDAFPIVLATQDTDEIVATVKHIAPGFGGINLEDIAAPRCFEIERRLQALLDIPVFHDDQHGTAMVVLAGLINAFKVVKKHPHTSTVVIAGAGAAGHAIATLLLKFGVSDLIIVDSHGIISKARTDLNSFKRWLAKVTNKGDHSGSVADALIGADMFIGVSKGGTITRAMVASMAPRAIVFALANPIPEIMPDEAKAAGAAVIATGRSDFANQINNSLGFPGIFRGALDHGVREITDEMLIRGARRLAALISRPTRERIIPPPFMKGVVQAVAGAIK
ncbi:MAG: NADP-dependent malic enzyme [Patescibacteria group bacterium]